MAYSTVFYAKASSFSGSSIPTAYPINDKATVTNSLGRVIGHCLNTKKLIAPKVIDKIADAFLGFFNSTASITGVNKIATESS